MRYPKMLQQWALGTLKTELFLPICFDWQSYDNISKLLVLPGSKTEKNTISRQRCQPMECMCVCVCVELTCEVCVVRGVNEIVREGKGHVFALVQLLGGDDAVLLAVQVPGEAFHRDLTCTDAGRPVKINTNVGCYIHRVCTWQKNSTK